VKAQLKRYAERIDALTLRERVLIFIAAALVLIAVAHLGFISPLLDKNKRLSREVAQKQTELAVVQAQLQSMARSSQVRPDDANRARLEALRRRLAQLDARIAGAAGRFTPPQRMREVLQRMLARNPRLHLIGLKSLPVQRFATAGAGAPRPIYRHALELSVSGAYLDLYAYLRQLENLPTRLYWGKADLAAGDYPRVVLKLTVYTLSFDPSWMSV
jgi:MSHA biogenesis protein MshJ